MKELDDGAEPEQAPSEPIDDELTSLVSRLAQRLKEQAQEPIDQARAQFEQQRKELETQLHEAREANTELHQQYEIQSLALTQESAELQDTRSMLQSEQTRNAGLNQALADFELRLQDKDEQIRSLEEKAPACPRGTGTLPQRRQRPARAGTAPPRRSGAADSDGVASGAAKRTGTPG